MEPPAGATKIMDTGQRTAGHPLPQVKREQSTGLTTGTGLHSSTQEVSVGETQTPWGHGPQGLRGRGQGLGWAPLRSFGLKVGMGWGGGRSCQVAGKCGSGDFRFRYSGVWSTGKRKAMG